ncbi:MAG TPA: hypothetical protein P5246_01175, partial [Candidatus Omnitrophota bacterium]|nr:hypothetical protein [Candidatus Omnitrophota bacterium]
YVMVTSLEPCDSCARWIAERGFHKCVFGTLDTDLHVFGQGMRRLEEAGVETAHARGSLVRRSRRAVPSFSLNRFARELSALPLDNKEKALLLANYGYYRLFRETPFDFATVMDKVIHPHISWFFSLISEAQKRGFGQLRTEYLVYKLFNDFYHRKALVISVDTLKRTGEDISRSIARQKVMWFDEDLSQEPLSVVLIGSYEGRQKVKEYFDKIGYAFDLYEIVQGSAEDGRRPVEEIRHAAARAGKEQGSDQNVNSAVMHERMSAPEQDGGICSLANSFYARAAVRVMRFAFKVSGMVVGIHFALLLNQIRKTGRVNIVMLGLSVGVLTAMAAFTWGTFGALVLLAVELSGVVFASTVYLRARQRNHRACVAFEKNGLMPRHKCDCHLGCSGCVSLKNVTGVGEMDIPFGVYPNYSRGGFGMSVDIYQSFQFSREVIGSIELYLSQARRTLEDPLRVLVLGSGSGIDTMAIIYKLIVLEGRKNVSIDVLDIDSKCIVATRDNILSQLRQFGLIDGQTFNANHVLTFGGHTVRLRLVSTGRELEGKDQMYDMAFFNIPNIQRFWEARADLIDLLTETRLFISDRVLINIFRQLSFLMPEGGLVTLRYDAIFSDPDTYLERAMNEFGFFRHAQSFNEEESKIMFVFTPGIKSGEKNSSALPVPADAEKQKRPLTDSGHPAMKLPLRIAFEIAWWSAVGLFITIGLQALGLVTLGVSALAVVSSLAKWLSLLAVFLAVVAAPVLEEPAFFDAQGKHLTGEAYEQALEKWLKKHPLSSHEKLEELRYRIRLAASESRLKAILIHSANNAVYMIVRFLKALILPAMYDAMVEKMHGCSMLPKNALAAAGLQAFEVALPKAGEESSFETRWLGLPCTKTVINGKMIGDREVRRLEWDFKDDRRFNDDVMGYPGSFVYSMRLPEGMHALRGVLIDKQLRGNGGLRLMLWEFLQTFTDIQHAEVPGNLLLAKVLFADFGFVPAFDYVQPKAFSKGRAFYMTREKLAAYDASVSASMRLLFDIQVIEDENEFARKNPDAVPVYLNTLLVKNGHSRSVQDAGLEVNSSVVFSTSGIVKARESEMVGEFAEQLPGMVEQDFVRVHRFEERRYRTVGVILTTGLQMTGTRAFEITDEGLRQQEERQGLTANNFDHRTVILSAGSCEDVVQYLKEQNDRHPNDRLMAAAAHLGGGYEDARQRVSEWTGIPLERLLPDVVLVKNAPYVAAAHDDVLIIDISILDSRLLSKMEMIEEML